MRQGYNSNRSRPSNSSSNFRPRGRGPFRGHQPYRPPTQGQIDHLMQLALESVASETGFSKLPMESLLLGALKSENFETPTPIQVEAIPLGLLGRDILGCAQTGTGKTLAFVIPMLNQLLQKPDSKGLILVPTRELALQIEEVIKPLAKKINLGLPVLLIGGVSYHNQFRGLEEPHRIIVATPGRLIDHLGQQTVNLSSVKYLVLDEADRMLDVGFKPQLTEILQYLPKDRQTMMLTATLSAGVRSLSVKYLNNPANLKVGETDRAHANITQKSIQLETSKKNEAVLELLKEHPGTVLIFVKTQIKTERVAKILEDYGVVTAPIHGGLNQGQRKRALQAFRDEEVRVLVATDVAARGLDIDHVSLVINYDLPHVIEDYVHRIGRTGRAGKLGIAVSLVSGEDRGLWRLIDRKYISTEPQSNSRGPRREFSGDDRRDRRPEQRRDRPEFRRDRRSEPRSEPRSEFRAERSDRPQRSGSGSGSGSGYTPRGPVGATASSRNNAPEAREPYFKKTQGDEKRESGFSRREDRAETHSGRKPTRNSPFKTNKGPKKTFRKFED